MVTSLLLLSLLCFFAAAVLFGCLFLSQRKKRKAAIEHANAILDHATTKKNETQGASTESAKNSGMAHWQDICRRADLPPTRRTAVLILMPALVGSVIALLRTGSLLLALAVATTLAVGTALWIYRRVVSIQTKVISQLPDFLEHMVRIAAVGNSLPMAFQGAASHTQPPLRPIIETAQRNTRAGMDMDRALQQSAQAYRIQPLEMVAMILGTSMRVGGRSDQIIQRMADFMRDREQIQREFKATTSETRMSAVVLALLPVACALLMGITSPDFFTPMFEDPLGKKILLIGVLMECVGIFLLWQLARSL